MRPWSIWWDFRHDRDDMYVVVQTSHPDYQHVDVIYECEADSEGEFYTFYEQFDDLVKQIYSGNISLHKWMKGLGHKKGR